MPVSRIFDLIEIKCEQSRLLVQWRSTVLLLYLHESYLAKRYLQQLIRNTQQATSSNTFVKRVSTIGPGRGGQYSNHRFRSNLAQRLTVAIRYMYQNSKVKMFYSLRVVGSPPPPPPTLEKMTIWHNFFS